MFMDYDVQVIIDLFVSFLKHGYPIALVIMIVIRVTNIFTDFVLGRRVDL